MLYSVDEISTLNNMGVILVQDSRRGSPTSIPDQFMCDCQWTHWYRYTFFRMLWLPAASTIPSVHSSITDAVRHNISI